jgi:hypothetical protein
MRDEKDGQAVRRLAPHSVADHAALSAAYLRGYACKGIYE